MKTKTDIHGSQKMYCNDFVDPIMFPLPPPAGQSFYLSCEIE